MKTCGVCSETKSLDQFYSNGRCPTGTKKYKPNCRTCENQRVNERYYEVVEKFYGHYSCQRCGYDKCKQAIEFHHIDSSKKDKTVSDMKTHSEENIFAELEKCAILCANCHREVHYGANLDSTGKQK